MAETDTETEISADISAETDTDTENFRSLKTIDNVIGEFLKQSLL
jgi:hypothetical protein